MWRFPTFSRSLWGLSTFSSGRGTLRITGQGLYVLKPGMKVLKAGSRLTSIVFTAYTRRTRTGPASSSPPSSILKTSLDLKEQQRRLRFGSTPRASRRAKILWSILLKCSRSKEYPRCPLGQNQKNQLIKFLKLHKKSRLESIQLQFYTFRPGKQFFLGTFVLDTRFIYP